MKRLISGIVLASAVIIGLNAGTHAQAAAPSRYAQLVQATNGFGYWTTYYARVATAPASKRLPPSYVNAQIARYLIPSYHHRAGGSVAGQLTGDLHLMNIPTGYRYHIDSATNTQAVETVHWLFGRVSSTPIDRLHWTYTSSGWKISSVAFVRSS